MDAYQAAEELRAARAAQAEEVRRKMVAETEDAAQAITPHPETRDLKLETRNRHPSPDARKPKA